jgi:hypothetical protein
MILGLLAATESAWLRRPVNHFFVQLAATDPDR